MPSSRDKRERREVRKMLRAGVPRATCERYLGGCRLLRVLQALEHSKHTGAAFDRLLKVYYADLVDRVLRQPAGLLAWLKPGPRVPPKIGKWRA